jgi:hypothetical protein
MFPSCDPTCSNKQSHCYGANSHSTVVNNNNNDFVQRKPSTSTHCYNRHGNQQLQIRVNNHARHLSPQRLPISPRTCVNTMEHSRNCARFKNSVTPHHCHNVMLGQTEWRVAHFSGTLFAENYITVVGLVVHPEVIISLYYGGERSYLGTV